MGHVTVAPSWCLLLTGCIFTKQPRHQIEVRFDLGASMKERSFSILRASLYKFRFLRDDTGNSEWEKEKEESAFQAHVSIAGSVPVAEGVVLEITGANASARAAT